MTDKMQQYEELIRDSLYDETFMLLEKNTLKITDTIEKNKYLRDFFIFLFKDEFFNEILDLKKTLPVASAFVENLMSRPYLKEMGGKINNFVSGEKLSIFFAFLLKDNQFERAQFLTSFIEGNLRDFDNTVKDIISTDNVQALRFVCENMKNIHFNEGSLLRLSSNMRSSAMQMLIDEFDFDINEQNRETGFNLVHALISEKNIKNFQFLVENYGDKINWSLSTNGKHPVSVFDLVDSVGMQSEFYSIILNDMSLKSQYIERIAKSLFKEDVMSRCSDTDIYARMFSHPNFDSQVINLNQGYLLYGLISRLGMTANPSKNTENTARDYLKILEQYIHTYTEDTVPDSNSYHIVGAAIHAASISESKIVQDGASLIMRRFKQYVNRPNPNGELPVAQVEKESPLFRLLVNNGAVPPEPDPNFWNAIFSFGRKKHIQEQAAQAAQKAQEELMTQKTIAGPAGNIVTLQNQMREDFREMKKYINNDLCDPTIKFKCENMFLKADKLATMMGKYNVNQGFEEMSFLSENFSNYLKGTLKYYIDVCQAVNDLSTGEKRTAKFKEAKEKCLEQVNLLAEQLNLISENIFHDVEDNAKRDLRVRGRVLTEKFGGIKNPVRLENLDGPAEPTEKIAKNTSVERNEHLVMPESRNIDDLDIDFSKPQTPQAVDVLDYKKQNEEEQELEINFPNPKKKFKL